MRFDGFVLEFVSLPRRLPEDSRKPLAGLLTGGWKLAEAVAQGEVGLERCAGTTLWRCAGHLSPF